MMGWRTKLSGGGEADFLTRWRRYLNTNPGVVKWTKRKHNKRARRLAKLEAENAALRVLLAEYNEQIVRMEQEK